MAPAHGMTLRAKLARYFREAYRKNHFPSLLKLLAGRKRLLAYYGFLGDGNFGDELVYEATKELLRSCVLVPVKRRMPVVTAILLKAGLLDFKGEVLGGGTLIGPSNSLANDAKPLFIHGTGTTTSFRHDWLAALNSRVVFGGVRGSASQLRLEREGYRIDISGDAAFRFFDDESRERKDGGAVLINFGTHNVESTMAAARNEIRVFVAALLERGVPVEFLPLHKIDEMLGQELATEYPSVKLHSIPADFAAANIAFTNATFAVGERLHFTVMSLLCGCPCFSVMYEPKHHDLLHSVDCLDIGAQPDEIQCSGLLNHYERRSEFNWKFVRAKMADYKKKQQWDADAYLAHLGVKV